MKIRTETKEEITTKTTVTHIARIEFDTMVVSERDYHVLLSEQIAQAFAGGPAFFALVKSQSLPDGIVNLRLNDKWVATVKLEE